MAGDIEALALTQPNEEQRNRIRAAELRIHEALADSFAEAMEKGENVKANPLLLARAFMSLLLLGHHVSEMRVPASDPPLSEQIVDLFWRGIGREGRSL